MYIDGKLNDAGFVERLTKNVEAGGPEIDKSAGGFVLGKNKHYPERSAGNQGISGQFQGEGRFAAAG